jgi:hypothetical protein
MDEIYHYEKRIVQVEELIIKDKDVLKFLMEKVKEKGVDDLVISLYLLT